MLYDKVYYGRVSTESDQQTGSINNQEYRAKELGINKVYTDRESATSIDREGFKKLLFDAGLDIKKMKTNGKDKLVVITSNREPIFKYIYCRSLSRFSRNIIDGIDIIRQLKEKGVFCIFEAENINTESLASEFLLSLHSGLAQQESETISQRVRSGNVTTAKKGHIRSWNVYGYTRVDDHLEIIENEAEIVKKVYEYKINGLGQRRIANALNEEGYRTRKDKSWTASSIGNILRNPIYTGHVVRNRYDCNTMFGNGKIRLKDESEWILTESDKVPSIITKEVYDKANEEIKKSTGKNVKRGEYIGTTELAGLIKCSKCGSNYSRNINSKTGKVFYNCSKKKKHGVKACNSRNVTLEEIDKSIDMYLGDGYKTITGRKLDGVLFKNINKYVEKLNSSISNDNAETIEKNNSRISEIKAQQSKLVKLYLANTISQDVLDGENESLKTELDLLEVENTELSKSYDEINARINKLIQLKERVKNDYSKVSLNVTREEFINELCRSIVVKEKYIHPIIESDVYMLVVDKLAKHEDIKEFSEEIKRIFK